MKKRLVITLDTIHFGSCRQTATLNLDGNDEAASFLELLSRSNRAAYEQLKARIKAVCEHDRYENPYTFKHVGDGIFEFKIPGVRLYSFYESLSYSEENTTAMLIIATNGGGKNTKKSQNEDISRAKALRSKYQLRKQQPGVIIKIQHP